MKIKNIYKTALCLLGLMLFESSCKKQLNQQPTSSYSSQSYWNSENDVLLVLNGVYAKLTNAPDGVGWQMNSWDAVSDDGYWKPQSGTSTTWTAIEVGQHQSTSGGIITDAYNAYYSNIAQANYFLANVTRVTTLPAASLAAYQAEVRTLRAYWYFQLVQIYGGVILTLTPEPAAELHPAKSTATQVYAQIIADLTFAVANLTNTTLNAPTAGYTGRVLKGTAQGLLAKVYLFSGDYTNAALTAGQLINDPTNPFGLYADYRGLFFKPGQRSSANKEIMLSARYVLPTNANQYDVVRGLYNAYNTLQPIANLANSYQCTDGLPTSSSPLYNSSSPYANRDPRLLYTVYAPGSPWPAGSVLLGSSNPIYQGGLPSATGFLVRKGLDETRPALSNSISSDQDYDILRYAEVLLIHAEAQNEVSGPDANVYGDVNKVRARVNMPALPLGLTQATMRDAIRNERRWEFALEGMRYFDLIRWKTASAVLNAITNPTGTQRVFNDPTNYLMPFPQAERDLEGNLTQNPGYSN